MGRKPKGAGANGAVADVPAETTAPGLIIRSVSLDELHCDPANARAHDERNLRTIRDSLKEFGQVEPLVVQRGTGKVIGGNGRLEAMRALGWTRCDVVEVDVDEVTAARLGLVLNRSSELATWDYEALATVLKAIGDQGEAVDGLGWEPFELEPLLKAEWKPPEASAHAEPPAPRPEPERGREEPAAQRWGIVIECGSGEQQAELIERFTAEGLNCRPLTAKP